MLRYVDLKMESGLNVAVKSVFNSYKDLEIYKKIMNDRKRRILSEHERLMNKKKNTKKNTVTKNKKNVSSIWNMDSTKSKPDKSYNQFC